MRCDSIVARGTSARQGLELGMLTYASCGCGKGRTLKVLRSKNAESITNLNESQTINDVNGRKYESGHGFVQKLAEVEIGRSRNWPKSTRAPHGGEGGLKGDGPNPKSGTPKGGGPKIPRFFPLLAHFSFFPLFWGSFVEFWWKRRP